jgi:hypothetical protein
MLLECVKYNTEYKIEMFYYILVPFLFVSCQLKRQSLCFYFRDCTLKSDERCSICLARSLITRVLKAKMAYHTLHRYDMG